MEISGVVARGDHSHFKLDTEEVAPDKGEAEGNQLHRFAGAYQLAGSKIGEVEGTALDLDAGIADSGLAAQPLDGLPEAAGLTSHGMGQRRVDAIAPVEVLLVEAGIRNHEDVGVPIVQLDTVEMLSACGPAEERQDAKNQGGQSMEPPGRHYAG